MERAGLPPILFTSSTTHCGGCSAASMNVVMTDPTRSLRRVGAGHGRQHQCRGDGEFSKSIDCQCLSPTNYFSNFVSHTRCDRLRRAGREYGAECLGHPATDAEQCALQCQSGRRSFFYDDVGAQLSGSFAGVYDAQYDHGRGIDLGDQKSFLSSQIARTFARR